MGVNFAKREKRPVPDGKLSCRLLSFQVALSRAEHGVPTARPVTPTQSTFKDTRAQVPEQLTMGKSEWEPVTCFFEHL